MKKIVAIALAAVMAFGMVSVGLADGGGPVAVYDGSSGGEGSTTSNTDSKDTTVTTGELGEVFEWELPSSTTLTAGTGIEVSGSVTATVEARLEDGHCIKLTAGEDSILMTEAAPANGDNVPSFDCYVGNGDTNSDGYEANGSTDGLYVCEGGGTDTGTFYLFGECTTTGTYSGQLAVFAEITSIPTTNTIATNGGGNG